MMNLKLFAAVMLLFVLSLTVSCNKSDSGTTTSGTTTTPPPAANLAPDFSYKTADGKTHKLSELRGKPVVINFWASWCPPCKAELPEFNEVYNAHKGQFELIAISVDDNDAGRQAAQGLHSQSNWSFTYAVDVDGGGKYMGQYIPVTAFINRQGEMVYKTDGMMEKAAFEAQLAKIL